MTVTHPNPMAIGLSDIRDRTTSHVYVMYMNYQFLIKGGVYAVAALALFRILTTAPFRPLLCFFWLASFSFTIVTIAKWSRGAVLTNARFNMGNMVLPIFVALPEYLLFIVLDPGFPKQIDWTVWYLVLAFHTALAFCLVANRYRQTHDNDFSQEVREALLKKYQLWMRKDMYATAAFCCIGILLYKWPPHVIMRTTSDIPEDIVGGLIFFLGLFIILEAVNQYREIVEVAHPVEVRGV